MTPESLWIVPAVVTESSGRPEAISTIRTFSKGTDGTCTLPELISSVLGRLIEYWLEKSLKRCRSQRRTSGPTRYNSGGAQPNGVGSSMKPSRSTYLPNWHVGASGLYAFRAIVDDFMNAEPMNVALPGEHRKPPYSKGGHLAHIPSSGVRVTRTAVPGCKGCRDGWPAAGGEAWAVPDMLAGAGCRPALRCVTVALAHPMASSPFRRFRAGETAGSKRLGNAFGAGTIDRAAPPEHRGDRP